MVFETFGKSTVKYGNPIKHVWKIECFSVHAGFLLSEESIESCTFFDSDNKTNFNLKLYPNGFGSKRDCVVLVLQRSKTDYGYLDYSYCEKFEASICIWTNSQKSPLGVKKMYMKCEETSLDWVIFSGLPDAFKHALPNDTLIVQCELRQIINYTLNMLEQELADLETITEPAAKYDLEILGDMFNNQKYCDFHLCVGDKMIGIHKVIVGARCPVFDRMFESDMAEKKENKVEITDIDYNVLWELLRYIYTGNCDSLDIIADRLMIAAEKYGFQDLKNICENSLCLSMSVENVADILILADLNGAKQLKSYAISFIQSHASAVTETDGWNNIIRFQPHLMRDIFSSNTAAK